MGVWDFIQNQVLGLKWLNEIIGSALSALGLDIPPVWAGAYSFSCMTC